LKIDDSQLLALYLINLKAFNMFIDWLIDYYPTSSDQYSCYIKNDTYKKLYRTRVVWANQGNIFWLPVENYIVMGRMKNVVFCNSYNVPTFLEIYKRGL
jgi:hypothetical protein